MGANSQSVTTILEDFRRSANCAGEAICIVFDISSCFETLRGVGAVVLTGLRFLIKSSLRLSLAEPSEFGLLHFMLHSHTSYITMRNSQSPASFAQSKSLGSFPAQKFCWHSKRQFLKAIKGHNLMSLERRRLSMRFMKELLTKLMSSNYITLSDVLSVALEITESM